MELKSPIGAPIHVDVQYSIVDYYEALANHAPQIFKDLGKPGPAWLVRLIVPPIGCVAALCTKKLKPRYHFLFSNEGMSREAESKKLERAWSEIVRVRAYESLFMIELEKGAMPIPVRFLTEHQIKTLREALVS